MVDVVIALGVLALVSNAPIALAYLWRRLTKSGEVGTEANTYLGFEGPVLCNVLVSVVTWASSPPYLVMLLAPWLAHVGTWIAVARVLRKVGGAASQETATRKR